MRKRHARRTPIAIVIAVATAIGLGLFASSALAGCYFVNGSCGYGFKVKNSPTPWTGKYWADFEYQKVQPPSYSGAKMVLQIVPYIGASGYTWQTSYITTEFGMGHAMQKSHHRCWHKGPVYSTKIRCSFD